MWQSQIADKDKTNSNNSLPVFRIIRVIFSVFMGLVRLYRRSKK